MKLSSIVMIKESFEMHFFLVAFDSCCICEGSLRDSGSDGFGILFFFFFLLINFAGFVTELKVLVGFLKMF